MQAIRLVYAAEQAAWILIYAKCTALDAITSPCCAEMESVPKHFKIFSHWLVHCELCMSTLEQALYSEQFHWDLLMNEATRKRSKNDPSNFLYSHKTHYVFGTHFTSSVWSLSKARHLWMDSQASRRQVSRNVLSSETFSIEILVSLTNRRAI